MGKWIVEFLGPLKLLEMISQPQLSPERMQMLDCVNQLIGSMGTKPMPCFVCGKKQKSLADYPLLIVGRSVSLDGETMAGAVCRRCARQDHVFDKVKAVFSKGFEQVDEITEGPATTQ